MFQDVFGSKNTSTFYKRFAVKKRVDMLHRKALYYTRRKILVFLNKTYEEVFFQETLANTSRSL